MNITITVQAEGNCPTTLMIPANDLVQVASVLDIFCTCSAAEVFRFQTEVSETARHLFADHLAQLGYTQVEERDRSDNVVALHWTFCKQVKP